MSDVQLNVPQIIQDLDKVKKKLDGTDRDDHLKELDDNYTKAKTALVKLTLADNEGIKLLLTDAKENLQAIIELLLAKPKDVTESAYLLQQMQLHAAKELYVWFLSFFSDAELVLKEVKGFVEGQLTARSADDEESDDYMGH